MKQYRLKPYHRFHFLPGIIICLIGIGLALFPHTLYSKEKEKDHDLWQIRETMVSRLSAEWYKIGILRRELSNVRYIIFDLRNIELFPSSVTKLNDNQLVLIDKEIEKIEKQHQKLSNDVDALAPPLSDALAILREMVIGNPVENMFKVLEHDDMLRIQDMLSIKHKTDSLWQKIDHLINVMNEYIGFLPFPSDSTIGGLENEFFEILQANLGQQSEEYVKKINIIKDSLFFRGNESSISQMFRIETHQIDQYLKQGNYYLAKQKILLLKERFKNTKSLNDLNIHLARIHFKLGEYQEAMETSSLIPDESGYDTIKTAITLQCLYALKKYTDIWKWQESADLSKLSGRNRNLALWIIIESGLALDIDIDYSVIAGIMAKEAPYNFHVLHSLSRSYIKKGRLPTALSVFKSAQRLKINSDIDKDAYFRILLSIAQTHFEMGQYELALEMYFNILNREENFTDALFGIAWCYIKLGEFQNAETTLRKLINQNPQSPLAAEAIIVMAQRYVSKAQYEWKKLSYLTREEKRINKLIAKLRLKTKSDRQGKYQNAINDLVKILSILQGEKREDRSGIENYYKIASRICDLVADHYETGSFQEISFSENREKLLHQLDSIILAINSEKDNYIGKESSYTSAQENISKIKQIVQKNLLVSTEIKLEQFRWEREYIDWMKTLVSDSEQDLKQECLNSKDSIAAELCTNRKEMLVSQMDSLVLEGDSLNEVWSTKLISICSEILKQEFNPDDEAYIRYHLGELFYSKENELFSRQFLSFEKELTRHDSLMALFNEGTLVEMPERPSQPVLSHKQSTDQFQTALKKYPDNKYAPAIRYSLAWCFNDQGLLDSSIKQMRIVAENYPENKFTPQAWLFLGEYYFDNAKLEEAIKSYQEVMKYPESEWFDEALYKLAWTQYRLSNPEKAISSFLALVDLGEGEAAGKALLETESMDYIAISFSESDLTGEKGLERATKFVKRFGDEEKGTRILHRLAKVFKEQGRYAMSLKTYSALLDMYPMYYNNYLVESELLDLKERELTMEESSEQKMDYFKKYNRQSVWAKSQLDSVIISKADSTAAFHLYDAAVSFHQIALHNNDSTAYLAAAEVYKDYVQHYPRSPDANECHYNYAEILFSLGNYFQAAEEYMAVSKRYPDSKYRETAAWNAIVASQNLLKQERKAQ